MDDVPHRKVRQGPNSEWVVTCGPAAPPSVCRKGSKESPVAAGPSGSARGSGRLVARIEQIQRGSQDC